MYSFLLFGTLVTLCTSFLLNPCTIPIEPVQNRLTLAETFRSLIELGWQSQTCFALFCGASETQNPNA